MPTAFAHAFVGASLSIYAPQAVPVRRLAVVLAVLPVLPDLDVIAFQFGIEYSHPLGHRGFTHSLPFALLAAVVTARLCFREVRIATKSWWAVVSLLFLATASHGVLDAFTDAGLGVGFFIPFDNGRYFFPWRPIATSPLSIGAFFRDFPTGGPAVRILTNEATWIGLPLLAFVAASVLARRFWIRRD